MLSFYRKYWKTAFDIGLIVLTVFIIMWVFSFLYKIATPIFFAFIIFVFIEPFARFLHKKGMKKSIATALSVLLFITILMSILVGAGVIFVSQITGLIHRLENFNTPEFQAEMSYQFAMWQDRLQSLSLQLPEEMLEKAKEYIAVIAEKGAQIASLLFTWLLSAISSFSTFVINFFVGLILAYFLSLEIGDWKRRAREHTPDTFKKAFTFLREHVLKGIGSYLKAQLKLISITFVLIFVGLLILNVKNAFSLAVLASFLDLLPLLGVSTLFIPWIVYLLVIGNTSLALWLLVLLAVVLLTRQIIEPKITGDSLGVSAFTMLAFMVISLSLFGVAGLILSPILIILIKELYKQGYLQQWIRKPEDYEDNNGQSNNIQNRQ